MDINQILYLELYRIRRFEETVLENFSRGAFYGTTHTYLGQEANAVGVLKNISENDIVFSNHRCHGHFLAYGGEPYSLFAELMGRNTGVCGGRGGSQHLHWRNFYSNGVQGGIVPVATGMALAEKFKKSGSIVIVFLGDGTLGEGVIYESFNIAALWGVPIFYILENNHIAQTTDINMALSGDISTRFSAFGIQVHQLATSDVLAITPIASEILSRVRQEQFPHALILDTHRFGPHSKGDDTRPSAALRKIRQEFDPIQLQGQRLDETIKTKIESDVNNEINLAYQKALKDPFPAKIDVDRLS
jgi:TPP-dependent pyruvate/acetoin dehydrogenase alpha subunit